MNSKLYELFEIGGKNNFEFSYKAKEGEDNVFSIDFENKRISALVGNPEDENLTNLIEDCIKQLKEALK
jgi:hypothetical protein